MSKKKTKAPSIPHFIEFRYGTDKKLSLKVPIKLVSESKIGQGNSAVFVRDNDKWEIWLSKERNTKQLCADLGHEADHAWAEFLHELTDAYIDWRRLVLED